MCLKIDWDSHIVGSKIYCFCFVLLCIFLTEGLLRYEFGGIYLEGVVCRNFTVFSRLRRLILGPQTVIIPNTVAI